MAFNNYYYHHNMPNDPDDYSTQATQPFPFHLSILLFILFMSIGFSWYVNYESAIERAVDQLRLTIVVLPLVLLLAVHWLSDAGDRRWVPFTLWLPERDSFHRASGSAWGIGLLLVVLLFMISHQSYFHDSWFPLFRR
ncbi:uncharacterized protein LOC109721759 [Ananas comosus]|uniref:Uncharacterized protein LOC109721759 n=2 Tax=Ananas comosus TaxID=4615 RepID=A0A6P5G923_ANACO|nr:uncharacterized protein LOC109721759 [Ananas comosus]